MNNDLISREALLRSVRSYAESKARNEGLETANNILRTVQVIEAAPTVDAVEVVRCKDCIDYIPWLYGDKICGRMGSYHGDTKPEKPDDYCSRGRKR